MTTMFPVPTTCGVCGFASEQMQLNSTSTFGAPDLDLRPAPLARYNLNISVQECPGCGYCAPELESGTPDLRITIESEPYRSLLKDNSLDKTARRFLCAASVSESAENWANAGWHRLQAAWAFDDAEKDTEALQARKDTLRNWEKAQLIGTAFAENPDTEACLLADVLRRCQHFAECIELVERVLPDLADDIPQRILLAQKQLAEIEDDACHRVDEVLGE